MCGTLIPGQISGTESYMLNDDRKNLVGSADLRNLRGRSRNIESADTPEAEIGPTITNGRT